MQDKIANETYCGKERPDFVIYIDDGVMNKTVFECCFIKNNFVISKEISHSTLIFSKCVL